MKPGGHSVVPSTNRVTRRSAFRVAGRFFGWGAVFTIGAASVPKLQDPQPLQKTALVVNLDEQTVFFLGYVVPIDEVDEASINFGGMQIVDYGFIIAVRGNIDRVTGRMDATTVLSDPTKQPDPNTATIHYDVVCRAT